MRLAVSIGIWVFTALILAAPERALAQAGAELWSDRDPATAPARSAQPPRLALGRYRELSLDFSGAQQALRNVPAERQGKAQIEKQFTVQLPNPDGGFDEFWLVETQILSPELAAKFPEIKTYKGIAVDGSPLSLRMDTSPQGLHAQVLGPGLRWHVDPLFGDDNTVHAAYHAKDVKKKRAFECGVGGEDPKDPNAFYLPRTNGLQSRSGADLSTYELAVATTGEYAQFFGGTVGGTLAAVTTTINRVSGIYELEVAVRFQLVSNNDSIIYTDPGSDPFNGNNNAGILIDESQAVIDSTIGTANYDVGHTFSTGAGGLAGLGVVCNASFKASGVTGSSNPVGDPYDVDYVAHELGHQFGGNHTFNGATGNCSGANRNGSTAFEPGSGSTIQAYAGICGADDLQSNSDPIFHSISFDEIRNHVTVGSGVSCPDVTPTGNTAPTVNAGADYNIPAATPFFLTASGSDTDGHSLTYAWEQRDLGPQATLAAADNGSIPLFRAQLPSSSPQRFLPKWGTVLSGATDNAEKLPTLSRTMNWRVTARDGNGGVNTDDAVISVAGAAGPFRLLTPNGGESVGTAALVTWDVAGTDAAPVSAATVDFYLSTDSGATVDFSSSLGTFPNTGSAIVTFPEALTSTARVVIRGSGNIFYDISNGDFTIDPSLPDAALPPELNLVAGIDQGVVAFYTPGELPGNDHRLSCENIQFSMVSQGLSPGIPFDETSPLDSSMTVTTGSDPLAATDPVSVNVDISHTYRGDVVLSLVSPEGTEVELKTYNGSDPSADVVGNYPATLTPVGNLAAFAGESASGEWTLKVRDVYAGDSGTLNSWSLDLKQASVSTVTVDGTQSPITLPGLTNGATYSCAVAQLDAGVPGAPSIPVDVIPGAPVGAAVIDSIETGEGAGTLVVSVSKGAGVSETAESYTVACGDQVITQSTSPVTLSGFSIGASVACSAVVNYIGGGVSPAATLVSAQVAEPAEVIRRLNIILLKRAVDLQQAE